MLKKSLFIFVFVGMINSNEKYAISREYAKVFLFAVRGGYLSDILNNKSDSYKSPACQKEIDSNKGKVKILLDRIKSNSKHSHDIDEYNDIKALLKIIKLFRKRNEMGYSGFNSRSYSTPYFVGELVSYEKRIKSFLLQINTQFAENLPMRSL